MRSEFEVAFNEITELRSLPKEVVLEALSMALVSAYRRDAGASNAQMVEAVIDPETGRPRIYVEKEVVEDVQNPHTEVELEKARFYDPEANLGDMVMVQVEGSTKKFGRIAAQTAKQVILQKIREAERNALYEEYIEREGDLINGTVQSINSSMVTLSLGRAEAILPRAQQIPNERYRPHDKLRTYVLEVKRSNRGPQIIVSRSHRNMLRRLLEYEVPEIFNGQVEIKSIAREAGGRSKVAVAALQEGIDPVGACVGMRGVRIQNIVHELHGEKIDVIEWSDNHETFIAKALSPARVSGVYLDEAGIDTGRTAVVIVPDDQLSLAIGREGQNARLAAKLTGWRIDIKSVPEVVGDALNRIEAPVLAPLAETHADLTTDVRLILEKKQAGRAVMPEEYQRLGKFAELVERRYLAERQARRAERLAEIEAVKSTLPPGVFRLPVSILEIPEAIIEVLAGMENVGEIMWRFLLDEESIRRRLSDLPEDSLARLQDALNRLVVPEILERVVQEYEAQQVPPADEQAEADLEAGAIEHPTVEDAASGEAAAAGPRDAFGDAAVVETPATADEKKKKAEGKGAKQDVSLLELIVLDDEAEELDDADLPKGKSGKKGKKKRRQLVFDETAGKVVAKRRRKGNRRRGDWDEYLD